MADVLAKEAKKLPTWARVLIALAIVAAAAAVVYAIARDDATSDAAVLNPRRPLVENGGGGGGGADGITADGGALVDANGGFIDEFTEDLNDPGFDEADADALGDQLVTTAAAPPGGDAQFRRLPRGVSGVGNNPRANYSDTRSAADCERACSRMPGCGGYTYVDDNQVPPTQRCYTTDRATAAHLRQQIDEGRQTNVYSAAFHGGLRKPAGGSGGPGRDRFSPDA